MQARLIDKISDLTQKRSCPVVAPLLGYVEGGLKARSGNPEQQQLLALQSARGLVEACPSLTREKFAKFR